MKNKGLICVWSKRDGEVICKAIYYLCTILLYNQVCIIKEIIDNEHKHQAKSKNGHRLLNQWIYPSEMHRKISSLMST